MSLNKMETGTLQKHVEQDKPDMGAVHERLRVMVINGHIVFAGSLVAAFVVIHIHS